MGPFVYSVMAIRNAEKYLPDFLNLLENRLTLGLD